MTDCPVCKDSGPCDMHCRVCGTDVLNLSVETYSIARWVPDESPRGGHNVLVATLCAACWERLPLP